MAKATSLLVKLERLWRVLLKNFSVPIALGLSLTIFIATAFLEQNHIENDNQKKSQCKYSISLNYVICKVTNSKFLGQVQNFSIIFAACLYILSAGERKKQAERQAWQLIHGARDLETSGARIDALEELNEEGVSLRGLDADEADLMEINLPKANLEGANLKNTLFQGANLWKACLYKAKLQNAKLQGATLQEAYLWGANLEGAELQPRESEMNSESSTEQITNLQSAKLGKANLNKAILVQANLKKADLRGAFLCGADLRETILEDANIYNAVFSGASNLNIEQIKLAKNWKLARYDKKFCLAHPEYNLLSDEENTTVDLRDMHEEPAEIKLLGLVHKLLTAKEIDKCKEIAEIRKKIAELNELLDSDLSAPLLGNPLVEDLTNAAERLIADDESLEDSSAREAEMRTKIAKFKEAVRNQDEEYQQAAKLEQEADILAEPYIIAGRWLMLNYKLIRREGIRYYLDKNLHLQIAGVQLNSDEKLMQLEADIDEALLHIATCLLKPEKPHYRGVELKLEFPIQSEILQVIRNNDVISKNASEQQNALSEQVQQKLDSFLKSAITTLRQ